VPQSNVPAEFLIFWFVKYSGGSIVASYNELTGLTSVIAMDTRVGAANVLNFNTQYLITGVNYISDLLFWTDGLNPPRRVDTKTYYPYNNFTEEDINVIVKPPLTAPVIIPPDPLQNNLVEANNMTDKFLYFSYRYKYQNNEYSALAPFSEVAFSPDDFQYDYGTGANKSMVNKYNYVDISFNTGSDLVKEIQLVFREEEKLIEIDFSSIDEFSETMITMTRMTITTMKPGPPEQQIQRHQTNMPQDFTVTKFEPGMSYRCVYK
jgi:hypothetical protein